MSVTSSPSQVDLRTRIGGRWAISWPAFLIGSILIVALITLSGGTIGGEPVQSGERGALLIAALAGSAGIGVIFWIGHLTVFRNRHESPARIPVAVTLHLISGAAFGLIFVIVSGLLGVDSDLPAPIRVVSLAFAALWWCLTMSLLLHAADTFARTRRSIIDDVTSLEIASVGIAETSSELRSAVLRDRDAISASHVEQALRELDDLNRQAGSVLDVNEWWDASAAMRQRTVGPTLAEEFRNRLSPQAPVPGLGSLVREVLLTGHFAVIPALVVLMVVSVPHALVTSGLLMGIGMCALLAVAVGAALLIANAILDRTRRSLRGLVYLVSLAAITLLVVGFVAWPLRSPVAWDDLLAAALVTIATLVAASSLDPLERMRSRSLTTLADTSVEHRSIQRKRISELADTARRVATGVLPQAPIGVHARFAASATGLERASRSNDIGLWRHNLEWCSAILGSSTTPTTTTVTSALAQASIPWTGFLDIDVDIDPSIAALDGPWVSAVFDAAASSLEDISRSGESDSSVTIEVRPTESATVASNWHCPQPGECVVEIDIPRGVLAPQ